MSRFGLKTILGKVWEWILQNLQAVNSLLCSGIRAGFMLRLWVTILLLTFLLSALRTHYRAAESLDCSLNPPKPLEFFNRTSALSFNNSMVCHIDELYWMQKSFVYWLFFKDRDFTSYYWGNPLVYDQPQLGRYIIGFGMDMADGGAIKTSGGLMLWDAKVFDLWWRNESKNEGIFSASYIMELDGYKKHLRESVIDGPVTRISGGEYVAARKTVFVFSLLSAVLIIVFCYLLSGDLIPGLLASLLYLLNPMVYYVHHTVIIDSICSFFALLTLGLTVLLVRGLGRGKGVFSWENALVSLLVGVSLGSAISLKFSTMYLIPFVVVLVLAASKEGMQKTSLFYAIFVVVVSCTAVFLALNPFLYSDPIGGVWLMIQHRVYYTDLQRVYQPEAIELFADRVGLILRRGVVVGYVFDGVSWILYYITYLAGIYYLAQKSIREFRGSGVSTAAATSLWMILTYSITGWFIRMDWERYYLPMILCSSMVISLGVWYVVTNVKAAVTRINSIG